ncbi:TPA: hypothetical protein HA265_01690 [Candidatus Woesearchaeota archaeon]|nr:hypothetical protein [Candidatus Woesearchaeota archaeon]
MNFTISEPQGGAGLAKLSVWEAGYKICLDVYRLADSFKDEIAKEQVKKVTIPVLFDVSHKGGAKLSKGHLKRLKQMHLSMQRLSTMMMFVHDLEYLDTKKYLELNSNMNYLQAKLKKIIKYQERKLKNP